MPEIIDIRNIDGSEVLDRISCADIAGRYFHRSRSWFTQRLNNNIVNGKPVSFTAEELQTLRRALKGLAVDLTNFTDQIHTSPAAKSVKVYVISDPPAIDMIQRNDIDCFREYLAKNDCIHFDESYIFATEGEAAAFCAGLTYGLDENDPIKRRPLCSTEESDQPFIAAMIEYGRY